MCVCVHACVRACVCACVRACVKLQTHSVFSAIGGQGCAAMAKARFNQGTEGDPGHFLQIPEYSEQVDTSEVNRTSRSSTPTEDQHRGEAERGG